VDGRDAADESILRLESITVAGFRCFGPEPISIALAAEVTTFVGTNASGKTALLEAFVKMFGVSRAQRTVLRSDFHLSVGADPDDRSPRDLFADVVIGLPELADGTATPESIAPSFRHMRIERQGAAPVCRIRLEARWEDDGTAEGEVTQELFWVDTIDDVPKDEHKHVVSPPERGLIQLYYTPATRDAAAQIRATTGALAARLLRAIEWSQATQKAVKDASETLDDAFEAEVGIAAICKALDTRWSNLHDEVVNTKPRLSLISRRFEEIVTRISVIFEHGPDGLDRGLDALSDGQQSLFYFALAAAVFDLERSVVAELVEGFRVDEMRIPALTIFAVEEPENHLSPYYLARIIRQERSLVKAGGAQVLMTSHSPAVLGRVRPSEVRYCRCDPKTRISRIKSVEMPRGDADAAKFVRGAMLAFPELYFARFVLLVEGDSERIVLPLLAKAMGLLIDPAFVAIVPLGGRHVQHFWNLLSHLEIPYATLLDLDLGRDGGGFGRVKTVLKRLLEIGVSKQKLLDLSDGSVLPDADLEDMHTWQEPDDMDDLKAWVGSLRQHNVFFSSPLDLDLTMLAAFPNAYAAAIPKGGGPKMSVDKAAEAVLGTAGPGVELYVGAFAPFRDHLPAYRYHFLTHSKPATHLAAMAQLKPGEIRAGIPEILSVVLKHIETNVRRD
jgi:putative ATP-dependent endonuclease of OLD family